MRTFLILFAFIAMVCAAKSHQGEPRETRNRSGLVHSRKIGAANGKTRGLVDHDFGTNVIRHHTQEHRASMARFVVHRAGVVALGTVSSKDQHRFDDYPGVNVQLVSDVIDGQSTGTPYVYMSKDDFSVWDLRKNKHATMLFSRVVIDDFCDNLPLYAKDPYCAAAILLGKMTRVTDTAERAAAYKSLTDKFSGLKDVNHDDYEVGKMDIVAVLVRGEDGKPEEIPLEMYGAASPDYTEDPEPEATTVRFG